MELKEALAKAGQILDEERAAPTVSYKFDEKALAAEFPGTSAGAVRALAISLGESRLALIRSQQPRPVQEDPRVWTFESVNYNLLCALHAQIAPDARPAFVEGILRRMASSGCGRAKLATYRPCWNGSVLPLISEFCVRNGATKIFFSAFSQIKPSPGQAVLYQHLEDVIALDFTVFSDAEYCQLALLLQSSRVDWIQQYLQSQQTHAKQDWAGKSVTLSFLLGEVGEAADCLVEECRKARYLYLRGSLLNGLNIEINQDKDAVQSYLQRLGFTETLAASVDEAERLYRDGSTFNLKASMGHLRSFLEGLHKEAFPALQAKFGGNVPGTWGAGLTYLRDHEVLSPAEEKFAASVYTIISDEAVHPLVAEREYARLFRNVIIEYALLLLAKLAKLGLKL